MMIISLSWRCHGVSNRCHKLLMSRILSRGCVTCCPRRGPMCTGSDAPLVTPRLSLRMRGSDQQVVAPAVAQDSFSILTLPLATPTIRLSHSVHWMQKVAKSSLAISHQMTTPASYFNVDMFYVLPSVLPVILNPLKVFLIWLIIQRIFHRNYFCSNELGISIDHVLRVKRFLWRISDPMFCEMWVRVWHYGGC